MNLITFLLRAGGQGIALVVGAGMLGGLASTGFIAIVGKALERPDAPWMLAGFILVASVRTATNVLAQWFLVRYAQASVLKLSNQLSRQVLATPFRTLERIGPARILTTVTEDVGILSAALQAVPTVIANMAILLGCTIYLAVLSVPSALGLVGFGILGGLGYRVLMKRAAGAVAEARTQRDVLVAAFRSLTEGTKELKMSRARRTQLMDTDIGETVERLRHLSLKATNQYLIADGWTQAMFFLIIGLMIFGLPALGTLPREDVTSYAFVALYAMTPIWAFLTALPVFQRGQTALDRIEAINLALVSEAPAATADPGSAAEAVTVEFQQATYVYDGPDAAEHFTLGPIDLTVRSGELLFLIGGNGSGKSTFVKLLTGLYAPTTGRVLVDGALVTEKNLDWYREHFSVVFSDFYLFGGVALNGKGGDAVARSYLELLDLSEKVRIENGVFSTTALSQGQRRRLALLCAYLEDRPIYVFDEWAADQDPHYREVFYSRLLPDLKARGKTVVVITHDDRFFHLGDRVVKLDYGRIVDTWTPG